MPLIILYLGNDFSGRFTNEDEAKNTGIHLHTSDKPAKIEFTPNGGGLITTLEYDPITLEWSSTHNE